MPKVNIRMRKETLALLLDLPLMPKAVILQLRVIFHMHKAIPLLRLELHLILKVEAQRHLVIFHTLKDLLQQHQDLLLMPKAGALQLRAMNLIQRV